MKNDNYFIDENEGVSFRLDFDCASRDGLYNSTESFAIYEPEDLNMLICKLQSILPSIILPNK